MKTICFDFDGVIHSYTSGWKGCTEIPDPPVELEQMKEELRDLKFGYQYEIVIFSTRCRTLEGKTAIWKWLEKYDLDIYIDRLCDTKPPAIAYVDDRGIHFDGHWKGIADTVFDFETWFEKDSRKKHTL